MRKNIDSCANIVFWLMLVLFLCPGSMLITDNGYCWGIGFVGAIIALFLPSQLWDAKRKQVIQDAQYKAAQESLQQPAAPSLDREAIVIQLASDLWKKGEKEAATVVLKHLGTPRALAILEKVKR